MFAYAWRMLAYAWIMLAYHLLCQALARLDHVRHMPSLCKVYAGLAHAKHKLAQATLVLALSLLVLC